MLLPRLEYGALLAYSPKGATPESRRSQTWMRHLKEDLVVPARPGIAAKAMSEYVVELLEAWAHRGLRALLPPSAVLVPAPRSSLRVEGGLWVPLNLATAMVRGGFGARVLPLVHRRQAVPKAARSEPGKRPTAQTHYETIDVGLAELPPGAHVVVVDDIITKGATLLGCASRLAEAYPGTQVRGFAAMRTKGLVPDITNRIEPFVGEISRIGLDADRGD